MKSFAAIALLTFITWTVYAEASQKSVEEMISLMKVREKYINTMNATINKKMAVTGKDDPLMNKVIQEFKEGSLSWDAMKPEFMKIYSENFSENEVNAICSFCKTKIGRQAVDDPDGFKKKMKQPSFLKTLSPADFFELQKFMSSGPLQKAVAKKSMIQQKMTQLCSDRVTKISRELQTSPGK